MTTTSGPTSTVSAPATTEQLYDRYETSIAARRVALDAWEACERGSTAFANASAAYQAAKFEAVRAYKAWWVAWTAALRGGAA